jgi:hypothetical protein
MRRVMRGWLSLFGTVCVLIALAHLFFGSPSIIGGGQVNATIDSDMRFYAVLFAGFGVGLVWAAQDLDRRTPTVNVLGVLFFVGGLARLLAWLQTGAPNWFYIVMVPVELIIPVANWLILRSSVPPPDPAPRSTGASEAIGT